MRNFRCNKCNSMLAKEEEGKLILRSGFGKRQVFHIFDIKDGSMECWFCKELNHIYKDNGKIRRISNDVKREIRKDKAELKPVLNA